MLERLVIPQPGASANLSAIAPGPSTRYITSDANDAASNGHHRDGKTASAEPTTSTLSFAMATTSTNISTLAQPDGILGGNQRNRSTNHNPSLKSALRDNPSVIGSGQSLGALIAADRGDNKCLLVTNLHMDCTSDDVLANLIAHCEATTDNVRILELSLRNDGSYGSLKVWCLPRKIGMAIRNNISRIHHDVKKLEAIASKRRRESSPHTGNRNVATGT